MDFERDQDGDAERFANWEKRRDTLAVADAYERLMRALAARVLAELTDTVRQFERGEFVDVLTLEVSAAKLAATINVAQQHRDRTRTQIAA